MPRDRYAVLRFLIALQFLCTFAFIGLYSRLHDVRRGPVIEHPLPLRGSITSSAR